MCVYIYTRSWWSRLDPEIPCPSCVLRYPYSPEQVSEAKHLLCWNIFMRWLKGSCQQETWIIPWLHDSGICIAVCLLHKHVLHPVIINMVTMIVLVGASVLICSFCNFRCSLPDTWHWANWCVSVRKMSRFQSQWRQGGKGVQRLPYWSISPVPKEVSYHKNGTDGCHAQATEVIT